MATKVSKCYGICCVICVEGRKNNPAMTFSLYILPDPSHSIGFCIHRSTIATFIEALPETCINLEIDTRGLDYFEPGSSAHPCDVVKRILPCLRNLRLCLGILCPAVFGADFDSSELSVSFFQNFSQWLYCFSNTVYKPYTRCFIFGPNQYL